MWHIGLSSPVQERHRLSGVSSARWDRTGGNRHILEHEKFQLDIRRNVFTMGLSNIRKGCLEKIRVLPLWEYSNLKGPGSKWGLDQKFLEIPSNLNYFMILWSITFFITLKENKIKILAYKTFTITVFITNYSGQLWNKTFQLIQPILPVR